LSFFSSQSKKRFYCFYMKNFSSLWPFREGEFHHTGPNVASYRFCSLFFSFRQISTNFLEQFRKRLAFTKMECRGSNCNEKRLFFCPQYQLAGAYETRGTISEEQAGFQCPSGKVLAGIKCMDSQCDKIWLYCQKPANFKVTDNCEWTPQFTSDGSNDGERECEDDEMPVVAGLDCYSGSNCETLKLRCCGVTQLQAVNKKDAYGCYIRNGMRSCEGLCSWSEFSSEVGNGDHPVVGIRCRGSQCGEISVLTCDNLRLSGSGIEHGWFSEEFDGNSKCNNDSPAITSIKCKGTNCDKKKLTCKIPDNFDTLTNKKHDTVWISEEKGGLVRCPNNYIATTVHCKDARCDYKVNMYKVRNENF